MEATLDCNKINYYWKKASIIIPNVFKKIEVFNYPNLQKQYLQEVYDLSKKTIPN